MSRMQVMVAGVGFAVLGCTMQAHAVDLSVRPTRADAMVVVSNVHNTLAQGSTVRCTSGKRVGAWVAPGQAVHNVRVEGCEVGIVQESHGDVSGVMMTPSTQTPACLVGIWLQGFGGTVTDNQVFGCQYGMIVSGDRYTVLRNRMMQSTQDGLMVLGSANIIEDNIIEQHGRNGINVVSAVPNTDFGVYLPMLRESGRQNRIARNSVTGGTGLASAGAFDLRQFPLACPFTGNMWVDNVFTTRRKPCLQ